MLLSRKGSKKMEGACIIQKNTLTRMVTDQLRQDILLGQIASGSRITVQSIAKRYNTSALPVREAMQILSGENLLEMSPYKGASVREINHDFVCNTYDILRSMEVLIVESCLPHWSADIRAQIVAANDEIHRLDSDEAVVARFNRLNREFHDPLEQFCINNRALELRDSCHRIITILVDKNRPHRLERIRHVAVEHDAIVAALDSGDIDRLRQAYTEHSVAARQEMMYQIDGE